MGFPSRRLLIAAVAVVWCGLAGLGLHAMFSHAATPGDVTASPVRWPADTQLPRGRGYTIAMFVHPDCPCSRASVHELAEIAASAARAAVAVDIVVVGSGVEGAVWSAAAEIARATRIVDDGREAARFGARTSGYTVVYDRDGVRRFAGGITGSRGHIGDNVGREAVQRIVAGLDGAERSHAVFGCALGAAR